MKFSFNVDFFKKITHLHVAARLGNVKSVIELIKDVNDKTIYGVTALHEAAMFGHAKVVEILIRAGADINAKKDGEVTALHEAAMFGHTKVVGILIGAGADINAKTNYGLTALDVAVMSDYAEVAKILIEAGADIKETLPLVKTTRNEDIKNIFEEAKNQLALKIDLEALKNEKITSEALNALEGQIVIGRNLINPLFLDLILDTIKTSKNENLKTILNYSGVNKRITKTIVKTKIAGQNILTHAIKLKNYEAIKIILEYLNKNDYVSEIFGDSLLENEEIDINGTIDDEDGLTFLHMAYSHRMAKVVKFLYSEGAIDKPDKKGYMPNELTALVNDNFYTELSEELSKLEKRKCSSSEIPTKKTKTGETESTISPNAEELIVIDTKEEEVVVSMGLKLSPNIAHTPECLQMTSPGQELYNVNSEEVHETQPNEENLHLNVHQLDDLFNQPDISSLLVGIIGTRNFVTINYLAKVLKRPIKLTYKYLSPDGREDSYTEVFDQFFQGSEGIEPIYLVLDENGLHEEISYSQVLMNEINIAMHNDIFNSSKFANHNITDDSTNIDNLNFIIETPIISIDVYPDLGTF